MCIALFVYCQDTVVIFKDQIRDFRSAMYLRRIGLSVLPSGTLRSLIIKLNILLFVAKEILSLFTYVFVLRVSYF
jgi:hypothetical protein